MKNKLKHNPSKVGANKGKLNAMARNTIPALVDNPVPKCALINGTTGMENNKPHAVKNNANPSSASFNKNLDLIWGMYKIHVPIKIFTEENTHAGAKNKRLLRISRNESIVKYVHLWLKW